MRLIDLVPALAPALTLVLTVGSATAAVDERRSLPGVNGSGLEGHGRAAFVATASVFRPPVQCHGPLACPGGLFRL